MSSSTDQHDNMYAEIRETNGQPEKPPIEFESGAAATADYDYAVVPKAGVFVPGGVTATPDAIDQPQSTPDAEHQYATISKESSPMPQGSSPRPLPKAHHKTPPPKPSPFSGKLHICGSFMCKILCVYVISIPQCVLGTMLNVGLNGDVCTKCCVSECVCLCLYSTLLS